jgi:hypothetical protein
LLPACSKNLRGTVSLIPVEKRKFYKKRQFYGVFGGAVAQNKRGKKIMEKQKIP